MISLAILIGLAVGENFRYRNIYNSLILKLEFVQKSSLLMLHDSTIMYTARTLDMINNGFD